ncbi:Caudovirus prohead protease [Polystyrenella longa]|uniref:Caudovirus prohead protease n=1 Tax=Polystyrenella longa TaxID=2528007 RepID=A0A518CQQ7_9PLAN|nr:HK97 family phage prohead protease [Polystyrenella longa]QDU81553.1 Caudovirus prohead protease [Polystyrenella longa]
MTEQFTKNFDADFEIIEGSREIISVISTKSIDQDKDIVFPNGMVAKNGTPILFNHDKRSLPIGKALWFKQKGNQILSKSYITDKTQMAKDIFGLIQDGIITGVSVGFRALEMNRPTSDEIRKNSKLADVRYLIRKWQLDEYSYVTFPCNTECVTLAVSKGYSPETVIAINGGQMPEMKDLIKDNVWCWNQTIIEKQQDEPQIVMPKFSKKW